MNPILWQRFEGAIVATAIVFATIEMGFAWWWLLALFLAFDFSAIGYVVNARIGAFAYNAAHQYGAGAAAIVGFLVLDQRWLALLGLCWLFHVAVDRAWGYGLKHADDFHHTHLGHIGRRK